MNRVVQFQDVIRSYKRGVPVLNGVTFEVNEAEVVGLLGQNGSGKTTLLRIAMGMLAPDSGFVRIFGLDPTQAAVEVKKRVGYVSEDQILPAHSSIGELVAFHKKLFPRWDEALERDLLEDFQLARGARIKSLSKGQARKVALLCAICHRPELLILDEPAGGLDAAARRDFLEASIRLLNREGTSILFSSHYMDDVERIGGRVLLLHEGRIQLNRDIDEVREDLCLAVVPVGTADPRVFDKVPGCLHSRRVFDDWHAVYQGPPEQVKQKLVSVLGSNGIQCAPLSLEDLFIEMVGSTRERRPS